MKVTKLDIVYRVGGDNRNMASMFASLTDDQQEKFAVLCSDFEDMWKSDDEASIKFVVDLVSQELELKSERVYELLREYENQPLPPPVLNQVEAEVIVRPTRRPDVRKDLLENLIKVKFARERKILYGEIIDMRDLDAESIKITHPRIYVAALQDAESLMKGIDLDRQSLVHQ